VAALIGREDLWQALHACLQPSRKRGSNLPVEAVRVRFGRQPALPARWQGPDSSAAAQQELDRKQAEFEALEKQMAQAARRDGLDEDGPMVPTLQALRLCMGSLRDMTRVLSEISTHYVGQILDALSVSRTVTQAETDRFRAEIEHTETDIIRRVSHSIAQTFEQAFARRARVQDRNSTLLAAAALVMITGGVLYGGYQWGQADAVGGIHETEADLQAALRDSPATAAQWVNLMRWNNLQRALAQCSGPLGIGHVQDGRLACDVPLWVQPPLEQTATRQFPSIELTPAPLAPPPSPPHPPPERTESRPINPFGILPTPPRGPVHFGPDSSQ
jgi:hypothetical protein